MLGPKAIAITRKNSIASKSREGGPRCVSIFSYNDRMTEPSRSAARIIVTGGTFDKRYDAIKGELTFSETHLPALLEQARVKAQLAVDIRLLIDSLQMTDAHRQSVLEACREAPERSIVVVHGTDTMVETAQVVGRAALDKTVVLTGAMV